MTIALPERLRARARIVLVATGVAAAVAGAGTPAHAACGAVAPARCLRAGELDPTFSPLGPLVQDVGNGLSQGATDMAVLADGRIVMVGSSSLDGGTDHDPTVLRFTAGGALDTTFGTGGVARVVLGPGNAILQSIVVQPDGRIVAAGGWDPTPSHDPNTTTGYVPKSAVIVRLDDDGTPDPSFGVGGIVQTAGGYRRYDRVLLQPDGHIVVVGVQVTAANGAAIFAERYDAGGVIDPTFGDAGVASGSRNDAAVYIRIGAALDAGGRIVVGASRLAVGPYLNCTLVRFTASGQLDPTFAGDGELLVPQKPGEVCHIEGVAVQPDGAIVTSGFFNPLGLQPQQFALMRFTDGGAPDTTFHGGKRVLTKILKTNVVVASHAVALQPDGMIVQAGSAGGGEIDVTRHRSKGIIDRKFGTLAPRGVVRTGRSGAVATAVFDGAQAVAILPDGRILVGGNPGFAGTFALARYLGKPCIYDPVAHTLTCP